jgi:hypothetical protein
MGQGVLYNWTLDVGECKFHASVALSSGKGERIPSECGTGDCVSPRADQAMIARSKSFVYAEDRIPLVSSNQILH